MAKLTREQQAFAYGLAMGAIERAAQAMRDAHQRGSTEAVEFYREVMRKAEELAEVLKGREPIEVSLDEETNEEG